MTKIGRIPELIEAGVNVAIGIDGNNASNYADMMRATYLVAGLFKDARRDPALLPAEKALEMATLGGARALRAEDEIGSLEAGKRADVVLHDRLRLSGHRCSTSRTNSSGLPTDAACTRCSSTGTRSSTTT